MDEVINLTDLDVIRERLNLLLTHPGLSSAESVEVLEGYIALIDYTKELKAKLNRAVSCR